MWVLKSLFSWGLDQGTQMYSKLISVASLFLITVLQNFEIWTAHKSDLFPSPNESTTFCLGPTSLTTLWKLSTGRKPGNRWTSTWDLLLKYSRPTCPLWNAWKLLFYIFCQGSIWVQRPLEKELVHTHMK